MFMLAAGASLILLGTAFCISGKVTGRRHRAGAAGKMPGSTVSLLKTPGLVRALATSATVLAVVDLTVVYLPAREPNVASVRQPWA